MGLNYSQIRFITGAPHGVNLPLLNLLGVCIYMGMTYVLPV